jgi:hypothetical protein
MAKKELHYTDDADTSATTPQPVYVKLGAYQETLFSTYYLDDHGGDPRQILRILRSEKNSSARAFTKLANSVERCLMQNKPHYDRIEVEVWEGSGDVEVTLCGYRRETAAECKRRLKLRAEEEEARQGTRRARCREKLLEVANNYPDFFEELSQEILKNKE